MEDVKKHIISEMDFCNANLEDARPNAASHIGSVTKYTALTLKAKAAMDLAGNNNGSPYWDVVLDCTNQIVNSGAPPGLVLSIRWMTEKLSFAQAYRSPLNGLIIQR